MMNLGEISKAMEELSDWSLDGSSIVKEYSFPNFKEGLEFLNKVGEMADKMNHHPDVMIGYGYLRLVLTTHSEKALTKKDFELAKEIDRIGKVENGATE